MTEVAGLKSGISVQIRRTDGRQHEAIVSNVNWATKSVMVEWPEHGETRGKEIDFETIFALNSYLAPNNAAKEETLEVSKIVRNPSRSSMNLRLPVAVPRPNYKSRVTMASVATNGTSERANTTTRGVENIPPYQQQISNNNRNNNVNDDTKVAAHNSTVGHNLTHAQTRTAIVPPSAAAVAAERKARRSNVVKEVEKLKQNREERRQRQAVQKEEKEALMNIDPGNPNWQFLNMIREYQAQLEFRPLRATDKVDSNQITVCVRKRPLNKKENNRKEIDVISIPRKDSIVVHEPRNKVDLTKYLENQQFRFDYAFDETCSNELVYHFTAKPLVQTIFEGGMATCFAYGQTGSGKTHTMGGTFTGKQQDCNKGIYAMVAKDVFQYLNIAPYKSQKLIVTSSFFEIYSGKVFDLLADKAKLRVLEDGKQQVQVVGLTERVVSSVGEVLTLIASGNAARTSGQTSANSNSSRSHAVFQLTLRNASHRVHGKFSLIDLAGNERGADTMSADRLTRMEGAEINKSLLALKECIRALGRKGAHLPFRASKLTQVLRDSFIGDNSRTCMIAMISPGMSSCEHSLNTLRYADRVKELAATDPMEESYDSTPEVEETQEMEQESDLVALRSLNHGELSADLYNFHEALSQLQQLEDDMLDSLKVWIEARSDEDRLIQITRNVDYDQDLFASQLDSLLDVRFKQLDVLRERVKAFRRQLVNEEEISKRITAHTPR
uniref:Kinesin-like protein n=1 Tax=Lygus hesperus TaxID=30085 RepID=A0A0A9WBQ3_LYGHE